MTLVMRTATILAAATFVAGCARKQDSAATDTAVAQADTPAATATPAAAQQAANPSAAPLAVDDIDRWQRGMDAELKAVQDAGTQLRSAKNADDSTKAMFAANDMSTRAAGAQAAGVSDDRYQFIRTTLSAVAGEMSPVEQEMNVKGMPPSMIAEMNKSRQASLANYATQVPHPVMDALKPRAAALRKQDLALKAERLKAAGVAH